MRDEKVLICEKVRVKYIFIQPSRKQDTRPSVDYQKVRNEDD
jgi:hypothetical protein